jgi:hypothetical protein
MNDRLNPAIGRRDLLRVLTVGAGAVAANAVPLGAASADTFTDLQKTKPRYRETADVKAFYKVNRY